MNIEYKVVTSSKSDNVLEQTLKLYAEAYWRVVSIVDKDDYNYTIVLEREYNQEARKLLNETFNSF